MYGIEFAVGVCVLRVRTEDKRREIVAVATELFQELGYDRTSMSLISERLGGSKTTLYGYFRSKEELLLAVLELDVDSQADELMQMFAGAADLREGLVELGIGYLSRRLSPQVVNFARIVASRPESSGIGEEFYRSTLGVAWMRLCKRFEMMMEEGRLRRADPWLAAMQWRGLVEQDLFDRRLLGALREVPAETIERAALAAADAFLTLYGPAAGDSGRA